MNRYYPLFVDLSGKRVLVIGGGKTAEQKIANLLNRGAILSVVAPSAGPKIKRWARAKKLKLQERNFVLSDLSQKDMVFCATDDGTLNRKVGKECGKRKILVNVVDRPALCRFIVPAVVRRGNVAFAVTTGGSSPALAKFLCGKIEENFGPEVAVLAQVLKNSRAKILRLSLEERKRFLKQVIRDETLSEIKQGKLHQFKEKMKDLLKGEFYAPPSL